LLKARDLSPLCHVLGSSEETTEEGPLKLVPSGYDSPWKCIQLILDSSLKRVSKQPKAFVRL